LINVNDFKNGVTIVVDNNIYQVIEFQHVKPGKGPAFVRSKLKNLRTGANIDYTFNAGIKVERAIVEKKPLQYLYNTGDNYIFMNMDTYDQLEIRKVLLKDQAKFLTENLAVEMVFYKEEIIGVNLADKIEMKVIKTEPATKGNTATSASKEATLETGLVVRVPLFIEEGEMVIVSSSDGKYVSRK